MLIDQVAIQIFMVVLNDDEINNTFMVDIHRFPLCSLSKLVFEAEKCIMTSEIITKTHRN